jgi:membrane-bound lytic murein transglycosylase D
MSNKSILFYYIASLCLPVFLLGCETNHKVHHFQPSPAGRVHSQNLEPAKPRLVTELIQSAQKEFESANASQEKGDSRAAMEHYEKMLDYLKEANLDPSAFYNLRSEFERIIGSQMQQPASSNQAAEGLTPATPGEPEEKIEKAFDDANVAQEKGDHEAALREYTLMLELLAKDHLDPEAFYNLRSEFSQILDTGEKQARIEDSEREKMIKTAEASSTMKNIEIEEPLSDRVITEVDEIMNLYPRNFQGGLDRSYRYLPYVKQQFAQAGLPEDLVYLAMVESQFSPKVVSKAGAAGMWQFMKATGSRYGLKADRYVDDRFNWKKATNAAVRHLTDLYEHFDGNWPLAVSAYNMGEGGVDRAVASAGGERNLWKLVEVSDSMQMETKKFYPKLLASIIVSKDPERFGFVSNQQGAEETASVTVRGSYALSALDGALELPEGTLRQLNPDLIRGVTPPSGEFDLSVPSGSAEKLASVISDLPQVRPEILRGFDRKRVYVTRRGDTIETIAKKCGVSVNDLAKANRLDGDDRLSSGRRLTVPGDGPDMDAVERATEAPTPTVEELEQDKPDGKPVKKRDAESVMRTYTIKPGDTLEVIAKREKMSLKDLLAINKIKDESKITAGDSLKLTPLADIPDAPEVPETTHVVRSGDSPAKIAKLYGVEVDDLLQWNKLSKSSPIHAGEKLVVRGIQQDDKQTQAASKKDDDSKSDLEKVEMKIAKGDSASSIASKYGVKISEFLEWNKLTSKSVLREGDSYTVYVKQEKPKSASAKSSKDSKDSKNAKAEPEQKSKTDAKKDTKAAAKEEPEQKGKADSKKDTKIAKAEPEQKPKADAKKDAKTAKAEPEQKPKADAKKDTKVAKAESGQKSKADAKKTSKKPINHVVAKGDSPSTIASKYNVKVSDLYTWNNWKKNVVLQLGQNVVIRKDQ